MALIMFPSSHDVTPVNLHNSIRFIKNLLEPGNEILLVTKPHLEVIETLCMEFENFRDKILFRFSIGSTNSETLKFWEPGATEYEERKLSLIHAFNQGFETSISAEPMLDNSVMELVDDLSPFVTESIWIGKMNFPLRRLKVNGFVDVKHIKKANDLLNNQTDEYIMNIYKKLSDNELVKWKESIKKILLTSNLIDR